MALITAEEARLHIPALTGTGEDTNLGVLITRLGAAFARYCGYPAASVGASPTMESTAYTLDHDGAGGRDLLLRVWPATAITSVYDDSALDFTDATTLVASSDYVLVNQGRTLRLKSTSVHGAWGRGSGRIRVAFTAGYATVPDDLKELAIFAVVNWWTMRKTQGRTNISEGGKSIGLTDEQFLPDFVKEGLAPMRHPSVYV